MKLGGKGREEAIQAAKVLTGRAGFGGRRMIEFRFVKVPFLLQIELEPPSTNRAPGNL
jgi:hypothetical protein